MESPPTINAQRDFFRTKKKLNSPISIRRSPIHTGHKREIQTDTLGVHPTFKKRENPKLQKISRKHTRQSSPFSRNNKWQNPSKIKQKWSTRTLVAITSQAKILQMAMLDPAIPIDHCEDASDLHQSFGFQDLTETELPLLVTHA